MPTRWEGTDPGFSPRFDALRRMLEGPSALQKSVGLVVVERLVGDLVIARLAEYTTAPGAGRGLQFDNDQGAAY